MALAFMLLIISLGCAIMALQGVTLWHKQQTGRAIAFVAAAFFIVMWTAIVGVTMAVQEVAEQIQSSQSFVE